jgi:amphi-Trp domain-containing protein
MTDETVHESGGKRSRKAIASYLRRIADALGRGRPVPADEAQTVTVDPPAELDVEIDVEREAEELSMEFEMAWKESEGDVETDVAASQATFELYEDSADEWRWRLRHDNGEMRASRGEPVVLRPRNLRRPTSVYTCRHAVRYRCRRWSTYALSQSLVST